MNLIKKIFCSILISVMTLVIVPVTMPINESGYVVEAASVKISKTKHTLKVGKTYTLKIKGTKKKVKWTSSNKKVATVNSKGKVTAKKKGTATITAKVGNKKYKCKITVTKQTSKKVYVTPTGKRYHLKSTCGGKNSKASTLSKAKSMGLTPCKKCAK